MTQGLEWAGLEPVQSPGRTAGQGTDGLRPVGEEVGSLLYLQGPRHTGHAVRMLPPPTHPRTPAAVQCGMAMAEARETYISISQEVLLEHSGIKEAPEAGDGGEPSKVFGAEGGQIHVLGWLFQTCQD